MANTIAADQAAVDVAQAKLAYDSTPTAPVVRPFVPVTKGPRNLTSDDRFKLVDANHDGVMDAIVVELVDTAAEAAARADVVKYAPYYADIAAAKEEANRLNAGRPADVITRAEDAAVAKAKVDFKGPVPPVPVPVVVP